jgi:CRISPR system Cascade subunit CasD
MSAADDTVFLRLAGPMQSWGTSSRLQLRRTDAYPGKSAVLGLVLCAMGIRRRDSQGAMEPLVGLRMGVRVDRTGTPDWDYHSAGAKVGIRRPDGKDGGIKRTAATGEYETLLSRRQYLFDASFLVALQGEPATIAAVVSALQGPAWPIYLGRKCCIPSEPVFAGAGSFSTLPHALVSVHWRPRPGDIDRSRGTTRTLDVYLEHAPGSPPPRGARLVHDVPWLFGFNNQRARFVVGGRVTAPVGEALGLPVKRPGRQAFDYHAKGRPVARQARLEFDQGLCVFCKSPAEQVHHVAYPEEGDTNRNLRSLCGNCHDACTMIEYARDVEVRVDPSDPAWRSELLRQIDRLLSERRMGRRRELLAAARLPEEAG